MKRPLGLCGALLLLFATPALFAANQPHPEPVKKPLPVPKERMSVTHASVTIDGRQIPYTATAGTLLLYNKKHQATASVFYIAYTEDGVNDANRPITFAYNGGPGSSSDLVNIGGFGPRRLVWPAPGDIKAEQPPYRLENNQYSILKSTDLVFVDAVGTGYSRIVGYGTPQMFYGFVADGRAFAQFIERYVAKFGRWNSPKFLLGESYGTTRNAVLSNDLVNDGVYLNGVIMCSTVLDFPTINFSAGNDLPYILYLPSYAAVAWYHHRLHPRPANLPQFIEQVKQFARGPYLDALFAGTALPTAQKQKIAQQLEQFTSIPVSLWLKADLRISLPVFQRRVMGSTGPMTGRYDGRFTTPELQPLLPFPGRGAAGAASTAINGAITAAFDNYVSQVLHYKSGRIYDQLSFTVFRDWNWTFHPPVGLGYSPAARDVAPALARAMDNDPGMQVMFNNGYFDMATPFFATEYTVNHMGLPASLRDNVHFYFYPVGHMLYVNPKALPMLQQNIGQFIAMATASAAGH
jgi:carboxypeptidase C (cathepsin A)